MEKLFDLTLLEQTAMGNKEFMIKMVQMFVDQTPVLLTEINDHLTNNDWEQLGAKAHKLKPSIDLMGIAQLKQEIRDIEQFAKNNENLEILPAKVNHLTEILNKTLDQLQQEFLS
jgi:HPt (histidine-containing phosphotransfer) domain-containing protein